MAIHGRTLTDEETNPLQRLVSSPPIRRVERARMIWGARRGKTALGAELGCCAEAVRQRLKRFNTQGLAALDDGPRLGRPATYSPEQIGVVVATALTKPATLSLPFQSWTLDRLAVYLNDQQGIGIQRVRIDEVLAKEGLRWRRQEPWFGERVDRQFAATRGRLSPATPPTDSIVICLDEMGPESAKSFAGQEVVGTAPTETRPAWRARQEIDDGRRGKGSVFGAFRPATGEAFTTCDGGRTIANWVDFLEQVDGWLPAAPGRGSAVLDNLSTHRALDILLGMLEHPRWEFVFQPTDAASRNLIEPWWKNLPSLARKGRRFETWAEIVEAVRRATAYWNAHRHPFHWGKRRRHRPVRTPGGCLLPKAA